MDFAATSAYLENLGAELHVHRKFEPAHMHALLAALDQPQLRLPLCVHVAGTNGKGSIAAMIEAIARAAGHRTGLYTSPHLQRVTERIRIQGAELEAAIWARLATRVRAAADALVAEGGLPQPPSYFEFVTALGFLAMAEAAVDLAVVEVGLGGRLDATNVLPAPVAVIAPVGLDHQDWLGSTLEAIAGEKAGILHPGVRAAVIAPQPPAAAAVIERHAAAAGVPLHPVPPPTDLTAQPDGCFTCTFHWNGRPIRLAPALPGRHQVGNALCAALAAAELHAAGMSISADAVVAGLRQVRWPGRLERLDRDDGGAVWLDGAHNPMAADALARFCDEALAAPPPVIVFACLRDKAAAEIGARLLPRAAAVVFTAPRQPRALAPAALAELCGSHARRWECAPNFAAAWSAACRLAGRSAPILITGSLYLVGEARERLCAARLEARA